MLGVVLLASLSCSHDELAEANGGNAIGFRTPALTRSAEIQYASDLEDIGFNVSAYLESGDSSPYSYSCYFSDEHFSFMAESFISSTAYYWPSDGSNLKFYAYAPALDGFNASVSANGDATDGKMRITGFKPAEAIANHQDFVVAEAKSNKSEASESTGVSLEFEHALSQIQICAWNQSSHYVIKVAGVRLGNFATAGTYTFGPGDDDNVWSVGDATADYETTYNPIAMSSSEMDLMGNGGNAMVVPQQLTKWNPLSPSSKGAYIGVKLNIKTKANANAEASAQAFPAVKDAYDWVAVPIDTDLQPGVRYKYRLDFTDGAGYVAPNVDDATNVTGTRLGNDIEFDVTVSEWVEQNIVKRNDESIVGIWQATGGKIDYNDDSQEDEEITDEDRLKDKTQLFYHFMIPEEGNRMIILDDNGNVTSISSEFRYDSATQAFEIPTLGTSAILYDFDLTQKTATILLEFVTRKEYYYYTVQALPTE